MKNENYVMSDVDTNRLVVSDITDDYRIHMLENNRIPGLLSVEFIEGDGKKEARYDISSRTALSRKLGGQPLSEEDVRNLIQSILDIIHKVNDFLLVAGDVVTDPDFIYVNNDNLVPEFCYVPGYSGNFAQGFSELLRDILGAVNQEDHDGVVLAYNLYQESLKDNYTLEDIERIINQ